MLFMICRSILSFSKIANPLSIKIGGCVASKLVRKSGGGFCISTVVTFFDWGNSQNSTNIDIAMYFSSYSNCSATTKSVYVTFKLIVFNSANKYKSMKYSWQNKHAPFRLPSMVDACNYTILFIFKISIHYVLVMLDFIFILETMVSNYRSLWWQFRNNDSSRLVFWSKCVFQLITNGITPFSSWQVIFFIQMFIINSLSLATAIKAVHINEFIRYYPFTVSLD